jgi:hypothetical protein
MKTLNVGLLLDSARSDKYIEELALWSKSRPEINISHLIIHPYQKRGLRLLPSSTVFQVILWVERMLLRRSGRHKDHYAVRDLSRIIERMVQIRPIVSSSGHQCQFADEDVEKIKALDLDLLISCGASIPSGAILGASRLGVISCLHGGFWECYHRRPQTGFVIRRLRGGTEAGDDLARGSFRTRFYYSLNKANVYKKSVAHLKNLLKTVALSGELPSSERALRPNLSDACRGPDLLECLVYACKLLRRICIKAVARMPMLRERFGISVLRGKWDQSMSWRIAAASLARGRYWADPFLHTRGGRTFCFVEDLVQKTEKGHITALELVGTRIVEHGVALQEPFHLSFPFLFEYRGELYMCPESCASRQIRVYRCTEFPLKWRLEKTLMDGVSAVDTLLFAKGGSWWMLTNIDESDAGDHCSELYLFSADSPLSTTWVPHRQNPILVDSIGGRNGGLIIDGERLLRLGQCQGFDQYGQSLRVYEIKEISESRYAEELVAEIKPDFRKGILGTHHLSTDGKTTVVDHVSGYSAA